VFGAEISDDLGNLRVGESVGEGRHLLAAVENLIGDLCRQPDLVLVDLGEVRAFLAAHAFHGVAVPAILIAKEDGARHLVGFFVGGGEGLGRDCGQDGDGKDE